MSKNKSISLHQIFPTNVRTTVRHVHDYRLLRVIFHTVLSKSIGYLWIFAHSPCFLIHCPLRFTSSARTGILFYTERVKETKIFPFTLSTMQGEDAEAAKIREERVAAYAAKKSKSELSTWWWQNKNLSNFFQFINVYFLISRTCLDSQV